jgi:hypothetical protein
MRLYSIDTVQVEVGLAEWTLVTVLPGHALGVGIMWSGRLTKEESFRWPSVRMILERSAQAWLNLTR